MYLLPFMLIWVVFGSCQSIDEDNTCPESPGGKESNVEISIVQKQVTRGVADAIPDEKAIYNLDILLFDVNGKFVCRRTTFMVNNNNRQATLPVGENYTAYFLANCRSFIDELLPDDETTNTYVGKATWEDFRSKLIDTNPERLIQSEKSFTSLPMWGMLTDQKVEGNVLNIWPMLNLLRSVASVDVYASDTITNFTMSDATLYFAPDRGYLGNAPSNVKDDELQTADSPAGMLTDKTLISTSYNAQSHSIANKLYVYDNNAEDKSSTQLHTRLIIGGDYNGKKGYYPIDFENLEADSLIKIIRNNKYIININSVSGPGYSDKETASKQPPIDLNVIIVDWNMTEGQMGVSSNFYLWTEKKNVVLFRDVNSTVSSGVKGNILSNNIKLSFKTDKNGTASAITDGLGIQNDRFKVVLSNDEDGYPESLQFIALGEYNTDDAEANSDTLVLISGRIRLEIQINRYNKGKNDWDLDDDITVDI